MKTKVMCCRFVMLASVLMVTLILSGCFAKNTRPEGFYVLNADTSLAVLQHVKLPLAVSITSLKIPDYLDRKQIVSRKSDSQLHYSNNHRWAGKLHKNLKRILSKNLSYYLSGSQVAVAPSSLPVAAQYLLEIDIQQFEKTADATVSLSVYWQLVRADDKKTVYAGFDDIKGTVQLAQNDYDAMAVEMSSLFARFSHIIADKIVQDAG